MREVYLRIVMNMIAVRNFSFKSCQEKDMAQSTMSLYQKPSEVEAVDGLLSPTSVLSSVIDETPEAEAKNNVVIVVENN